MVTVTHLYLYQATVRHFVAFGMEVSSAKTSDLMILLTHNFYYSISNSSYMFRLLEAAETCSCYWICVDRLRPHYRVFYTHNRDVTLKEKSIALDC
jgi:hypothetical protein